MKLGLVSAILEWCSFEEMMDIASEYGYQCVEVACWPNGKAERRYAGVSHIDCERVINDSDYAEHIREYCKKTNVDIAALAFYPNIMTRDIEKSEASIDHLKKVIRASAVLEVYKVTSFIGRDQSETIEENLLSIKKVWTPIMEVADEYNVRIAIENCPMLFDDSQWPGGQNLMTTPAIWRKVFQMIPSKNLGLAFDPSHFIWQMMDYIKPVYEFRDKIFHVHYKDIRVYKERLNDCGIMAYPLEYMSPKLPGYGDVDWGRFISAVTDIGYRGDACVEIEDKAFEGSREQILESIRLARNYILQYHPKC